MKRPISRRGFVAKAIAASTACPGLGNAQQAPNKVRGFDHVAFPMQNTEAMLQFYRRLGFEVAENAAICSVYIGDQMINFHRPAAWRRESFTLRASAAKPPCGDLCFVWGATPQALKAWLDAAGEKVTKGHLPRQGERRKASSSVYTRDPDGNLLEFMIYG